jgi:hypothetical protein
MLFTPRPYAPLTDSYVSLAFHQNLVHFQKISSWHAHGDLSFDGYSLIVIDKL